MPGAPELSTVVMAHPSRRRQAERLQREHPELHITVVFDPQPDRPPSALRTAAVAWKRIGDSATHHLVLQDDVTLCRDFEWLVHRIIGARPAEAIVLFSEWSGPTGQAARLAALRGCSWTPVAEHSVPPVGVILSKELATGFGELLSAVGDPDHGRDSQLLYEYLHAAGVTPHVCIPNLVEHDLHPLASIWPGNITKGLRRSVCFADNVPGSWDCTATAASLPPVIPYHSYKSLRAMAAYARSADNIWHYGDTATVFTAMGMDLSNLKATFQDRLPDLADELVSLASPAYLYESWLTAVAMGIVTARVGGLADHTHEPVPTAAIRTLIQGPLRRVLSAPILARVADAGSPLLTEAVALGRQIEHEQAPGCSRPDWHVLEAPVPTARDVTP